jgi:hypothetical protein
MRRHATGTRPGWQPRPGVPARGDRSDHAKIYDVDDRVRSFELIKEKVTA